MNRNLYRLVQNTLGQWVAVPEIARGQHKGGGKARKALKLALMPATMLGFSALVGMPSMAMAAGSLPTAFDGVNFATYGKADYQAVGNTGTISQVGDRAIVNFKDFNIGVGNKVIYQQVKDLDGKALVDGATFNNLTRIWDNNPSVIAGAIQAATGQHVNLMLINQNGILFTGSSQVDVGSLTVSSLDISNKAIQDYIKGNIAPVGNTESGKDKNGNSTQVPLAQFVGSTGFVKVVEGARISASDGGSVIMIGPTVTNRGTIHTSGGGQSVLAAGNKVYLIANEKSDGTPVDGSLRGFLVEVDTSLVDGEYNTTNSSIPSAVELDGQKVNVADGYDKLGNATNLGSIIAEKGNITMVGLAVNQMGRATATTSLSLNGSIYLSAKDSVQNVDTASNVAETVLPASRRAGQLIIGANSKTQVVLETKDELAAAGLTNIAADNSTRIAAQDFAASKIQLVGKDIDIQSNSLISARNGEVDVYAVTDPAAIAALYLPTNSATNNNSIALISNPFGDKITDKTKQAAHIFMAKDATIDVSGVDTTKSVADNYAQLTLRSAELKDSPINRDSLRLQEVWVDLIKGSTLIANVAETKANMKLGLSDSAGKAGNVNLKSTGEVVVDQGANFNVAGGKATYTSAVLNQTQLIDANGKIYNIENAPVDVKYVGVVGQYTKNHAARWGADETWDIGNLKPVAGYTVLQDAGSVNVMGVRNYFAGTINAKTSVDESEAISGPQPIGASLSFDNYLVGQNTSLFGVDQSVVIGSAAAALNKDFKAGDNLSGDLANTLHLDAALFGGSGVNNLSVKSTANVVVDKAITMAPTGSVSLSGHNVTVNADIKAQSGNISLAANMNTKTILVPVLDNQGNPTNVLDVEGNPVFDGDGNPIIKTVNGFFDNSQAKVVVSDQVKLNTAGGWYNESLKTDTSTPKNINAGSVTLTGSNNSEIQLGNNSVIDVRGGGYLATGNKLTAGNSGNVTLQATKISSNNPLQDHLKAEALGQGGTLSVRAANVTIANVAESNSASAQALEAATLSLDPRFFQQGFGQYNVTGQLGVNVANSTQILVQTKNYQLNQNSFSQSTGADMADVASVVVLPDQQRKAASVSLSSSKLTPTSPDAVVDQFGVTRIGEGAAVIVDPAASIALSSGKEVEVNGALIAKAGSININADVIDFEKVKTAQDSPDRVHLGANSVLDASGVAKVYQNGSGLNTGSVLAGGTVNITTNSYLSADQGASIDVHGASPVTVDVLNTNGTVVGRSVASNGGAVNISAIGALTQNIKFNAAAGSVNNQGGSISLNANKPADGLESTKNIILGEGEAFASSLNAEAQKTTIIADLKKLVDAGFDNIKLTADNSIGFTGDINAGKTNAGVINTMQFIAPTITSGGANTQLQANIIRFENSSGTAVSPATAESGSGVLSTKANLVELSGPTSMTGFSTLNFESGGEFRLTGKQSDTSLYAFGSLDTKADINIKAAVVTPSTMSDYTITTPGNVNFYANGAPTQLLSALGKLTVNAQNINQAGTIIAPYGSVNLTATENLTLADNSITSVSAGNATLPFGKIYNSLKYYLNVRDDKATDANTISSLATKNVSLNGKSVDVNTQAKVDISGGGDLQAWAFTAGPGGSSDKLAQNGVYAIVPSYQGIAAPSDRVSDGAAAALGQRIYLSGGNGLAAGYYTLMPAHYALLPGAFAIKLTNSSADLVPANNYAKQDGTAVMAGFLADSRQTSAEPTNARWSGFEVLTHDQVVGTGVRDAAGYTVTSANKFFANNTKSALPSDAGLLQIEAQTKLNLDGQVNVAAASGGRNGALDIASNSNIAVVDGTASASDEITLDVTKLNNMKLGSLLLGGKRQLNLINNMISEGKSADDTTTINVTSNQVRVDVNASNPLSAEEVILVAKDTVALQNNSKIVAAGNSKSAATYKLDRDGALLRAATSYADITRVNTAQVVGTLLGDIGTQIVASNAVWLDATKDNLFKGNIAFAKDGQAVAGNLTLSSSAISMGDAVPNGTNGLVFDQTALNAFNGLNTLRLRSYNAFDFYGNTTLGAKNEAGAYTLQNLSLEGSGLSNYTDGVVSINATNITLKNPDTRPLASNVTGQGQLNMNADKLTLGIGDKRIAGFTQTNINATEIVGQGKGTLTIDNNTAVNTARMSGEANSDQKVAVNGTLDVQTLVPTKALASNDALGANWTLSAHDLNFNSNIETHSGDVSLQAKNGNLVLGSQANVDVSGKAVQFFDKTEIARAGNVKLLADHGNVVANAGAKLNVSAADGGNAGSLTVRATEGIADVASATLLGTNNADKAGNQGKGASFTLDANTITNFDHLNQTLNTGGFNELRDMRLRTGDLALTQTGTGSINAHNVKIEVDGGRLDVANEINADGTSGGKIQLIARDDVTLKTDANLHANATTSGKSGGTVSLESASGTLNLQSGKINVADSQGNDSGEILLRASRTDTAVAVNPIATELQGAANVVLSGVRTYTGKDTITATNDTGTNLSINTVLADNDSFMANKATISNGLGAVVKNLGAKFHLRGEAEVVSDNDITVKDNIDLYQANRQGGEAGTLTLRANGNVNVNGNISDGFTSTGALANNDSWSYRFVAGADKTAASAMAVKNDGTGDFTLAASKTIRTGTGDIEIATGGNFTLLGQSTKNPNELSSDKKTTINNYNTTSTIYTAGKQSDSQLVQVELPVPKSPTLKLTTVSQYYGDQGGDITLNVSGNVNGAMSNQLYSNWLQRSYTASENGASWGVSYSDFKQGIATFGGGDINVLAGGNVTDLSLSAVTTRNGTTGKTYGGGDVVVNTQENIGGGSYYVEQGTLALNAQGKIGGGSAINYGTLKDEVLNPIIALGNAKAEIYAKNEVDIQAVLNPFTMPIANAGSSEYFTTYSNNSSVKVTSLQGDINLNQDLSAALGLVNNSVVQPFFWNGVKNIMSDDTNISLWPGTLKATALQGDISLTGKVTLMGQRTGQIEFLANNSVNLLGVLLMGDKDVSSIPNAINPSSKIGDLTIKDTDSFIGLLHESDTTPARIYAKNGDIEMPSTGGALKLPKSVRLIAGNDIINPGIDAQNISSTDVTYLKAGRDIVFNGLTTGVKLGGPGVLEIEAGRNVDLGASMGIETQGNQLNAALSAVAGAGASVRIATGVKNGVDYEGAVDRLLAALEQAISSGKPLSDSTLWEARWLLKTDNPSGYSSLGSATNPQSLFAAVSTVRNMSSAALETRVRTMFYQGLRDTAADHNNVGMSYDRGYDLIELLFPGIGEKNADGTSKNYAGSLRLPLSRITTVDGGDIEFMTPGGGLLGGLTNLPYSIVDGKIDLTGSSEYGVGKAAKLGIIAVGKGSVHGFSLDSMVVNQSRILTTGNAGELSNLWLWSSEGDIDAGKGPQTAVSIPPPIIKNVGGVITVTQNNAANGSGIGALGDAPVRGYPTKGAGEVALIAPQGSVDAGDAGIRAGNILIAAQTVIGADNISASGSSSGVPVSDAGALSGSISGASGAGGDAAKQVSDQIAQNTKQATENNFKKTPSPSFINVEVVSIGD